MLAPNSSAANGTPPRQPQETNAFFDRLFALLPDLVYVYDLRQERNVYTNRPLEQALGYSSDDISALGTSMLATLMHPGDFARLGELRKNCTNLEDHQFMTFEYRMRRANGDWCWLESRESVFTRNAHGVPEQMLGITRDVTNHKVSYHKNAARNQKSEETYPRTELQFRECVEAMVDAVAIFTAVRDSQGQIVDFRFQYINEAGCISNGQTYEQQVGRTLLETNPHFRSLGLIASYAQVVETGIPLEITSDYYPENHVLDIRVSKLGDGIVAMWRNIAGQRRSDIEMAISAARQEAALQIGKIGTWELDFHSNHVAADAVTVELFGLPQIENVAYRVDHFIERIHPADAARIQDGINRTRELGVEHAAEYRVIAPDGSIRWLISRGNVVRTGQIDGEKPVRMAGAVMDITEQRRALDALREGEQVFRAMSEAIPEILFTLHADGKTEYMSGRFFEYTGFPKIDVWQGDEWMSAIHPDDLARMNERWPHVIELGETYVNEARMRGADGQYRWFYTRAIPLQDEKGVLRRWIGTSTEIDTLKRTQMELEASRARLQHIFDHLLIFVLSLTPEGVITDANRSTLETVDGKRDVIIGKRLSETEWWNYSDETRDLIRRQIERAAHGEIIRFDGLARVMGDQNIIVDMMLAPLFDEDGRVESILLSGVDITARKHAEEALQEREQLLELVIEAAKLATYSYEPAVGKLVASPRMSELIGRDANIEPNMFVDWVHPADRPMLVKAIEAAVNPQGSGWFDAEYRILLPDGSQRWVLGRSQTYFEEVNTQNGTQRKMARVVGALQEISGRKQAQQRTVILQNLAAALSASISTDEVADAILQHGIQPLGARHATLSLLSVEGELNLLHVESVPGMELISESITNESLDTHIRDSQSLRASTIQLDTDLPLAAVIRAKEPLWFAIPEDYNDYLVRHNLKHDDGRYQTRVVLPMLIGEKAIGGLEFCFDRAQTLDSETRSFLLTLAHYCAQATERAYQTERAHQAAALAERQRLARDLHDAVSQALFSATVMAEGAQRIIDRNPERARELIGTTITLNRGAQAEMRTLLLELRPEAILRYPLQKLMEQLIQAAQGRKEIDAELIVVGAEVKLPPAVHEAFYRMAQESINNILKHSQATTFKVHFAQHRYGVSLRVTDKGVGFNLLVGMSGMGLGAMRERAEAIDAVLKIKSKPGEGTEVYVVWGETPPGG